MIDPRTFAALEAIKREADSAGLTLQHLQTMALVCARSRVTLDDLVVALDIDKPRASRLLGKLYQAKLVTRREDAKDMRVVFFAPTARGVDLDNRIASYLDGHNGRSLLTTYQRERTPDPC